MRRMPQPFDSSDIPVVTHHQQGDYMTTERPYKPNDYTLHPMSMSVLGLKPYSTTLAIIALDSVALVKRQTMIL